MAAVDDNAFDDYEQYRLTISLNVLNHLGINLYSNVPAVLAEVVANGGVTLRGMVGSRKELGRGGHWLERRG